MHNATRANVTDKLKDIMRSRSNGYPITLLYLSDQLRTAYIEVNGGEGENFDEILKQ